MKLSSICNQLESIVHGGIWISAVIISIFNFYTATKDLSRQNTNINISDSLDFKEGWFINTYQDVSDPEWSYYLTFIKKAIIPLVLHLALCQIVRWFNKTQYLTLCYIAVSVSFVFYHFTYLIAGIILFQPIIIHLYSKNNNKKYIWVGSIISLHVITLFKDLPFYDIDLQISDVEHFTAVLAVFWTHLRCVSYYLDVASHSHSCDLIEMFAYALYFPTLFTGPFISYSDFKNSTNYSKTKTNRVNLLIKKACRFGFWLVFIEFVLHFVYVNAIYFKIETIAKFDSWTIYGYGYCMGQYFHMKYVVMYGFSTAIAEFDGAKIPKTPKCIGRIHLYSDMWKYFDRGLYKFLLMYNTSFTTKINYYIFTYGCSYIYRPLLYWGSFLNKLIASFVCFAFVFCWHGIQRHIFIWVALNYVGIMIELLCTYIYQTYLQRISAQWISMQTERRLISFVTIPLLIMSAFSNFYFFAGEEIGDFKTILVLIAILFSCCEICAYIKSKEMTSAAKDD